jgi:hypothetical protein
MCIIYCLAPTFVLRCGAPNTCATQVGFLDFVLRFGQIAVVWA